MKSQTVIILWIVALTLGITASIVKFGKDEESVTRTKLSPGDRLVSHLPIRKVAKVTLQKDKQSATLVKLDQETWGIKERDNYPVNYELLRNLLGALSELEVTQGYPTEASQHQRFGLAADSGGKDSPDQATLVTIIDGNDSVIEEVYLGNYTGTTQNAGRFLRIGSDTSGVYMVNETFPGVSALPKDWLNKDFLQIDQIASIEVSAPADPEFKTWKLIRQSKADGSPNPTGQFILADMSKNEVMELTSTGQFRNLLKYSNFQDVLSTEQASASAGPDPKLRRHAVIATYDGLTYHLDFQPEKKQTKLANEDSRLPPIPPGYLLSIKISASPTDEKPNTNGTAEKDPDESASVLALRQKLEESHLFAGRVYLVSETIISPLLKKRSDFVKITSSPQG
jgi:hypothetical protein